LISTNEKIITRLKTHRDKALAHSDAKYFSDQDKLYENYPLEKDNIEKLISTAKEILSAQYVYLMQSSLEIRVYSVHNLDSVLKYVRAYKRILDDKENGGAEFLRYKWDNYVKKEIFKKISLTSFLISRSIHCGIINVSQK